MSQGSSLLQTCLQRSDNGVAERDRITYNLTYSLFPLGIGGESPSGKALGSGSSIRGFESLLASQEKITDRSIPPSEPSITPKETAMPFSPEFSYRTCPWCNTQDVSMPVKLQDVSNRVASGGNRQWTWLACPRCGGAVSVETHIQAQRILKVVPETASSELRVNHLPGDVQEYYNNAQTVLNAGVPSSAAVELRRTLEAAAQHFEVSERTLVKSIEKLAEKGLITESFTDVLGHIRKVGNVGAHASDQNLTHEEVNRALTFTTQVLRNLFEIPEELKLLGMPTDQEENDNQA